METKTDRIFNLIKILNESDEFVCCIGKRILRYIYHEIYRDFFDECKSYKGLGYKYPEIVNRFSAYLDGEASAITYFSEMVVDNDQRFIEFFVKKAELFLDMIENEYYDPQHFSNNTFTFNLYSMLRAYHSHKDNFELFSKIVDDCSVLIDFPKFTTTHGVDGFINAVGELDRKKDLLNSLIDCKWYDKSDFVKEALVDVLKRMGSMCGVNYFYTMKNAISKGDTIYEDFMELQKDGFVVDIANFDAVIRKFCQSLIDDSTDKLYYDKKLLIANRYTYFNDSIYCMIGNPGLVDLLALRILRMDFSLFEEMNKSSGKNSDSFEDILDIIFDSDSFYEVESKLKDLEKACFLFADGKKDEAKELIGDLESKKHKKVLDDGRIVETDCDTINLVKRKRKKSVMARTTAAYSKLYPHYDIASFITNAGNSTNIQSFDNIIMDFIQEKINEDLVREREKQQENTQYIKAEISGQSDESTLIEDDSDQDYFSSFNISSDDRDCNDSAIKSKKAEETGFSKIKSFFGRK